MATSLQELHSFVGKFTHLCAFGIMAELNLTHSNCGITVNLSANIGSIEPVIDDATITTSPKNFSNSQIRRRRRRYARRKFKLDAKKVTTLDIHNYDELEQLPEAIAINSDVTQAEIDTETQFVGNDRSACNFEVSIDSNLEGDCNSFDFGVSDILSGLPHSNNSSAGNNMMMETTTNNEEELELSTQATSGRPISKTEFFNYMENFNSSFGQILEKKLAGIFDNQI